MQTTPTRLRWLYVDFNSYFASVEQQLHPELRGKPVMVVPVMSDYTSAIAASYEAKAFGVKTGTRVKDARQMCPGIVAVLADHEHYVAFHQRIIAEVEKHIPVTVVASIDEVACQLMDNEASAEEAVEIAMRIKQGLAKNVGEYVRCSIGIAPSKYLAKVATDLKKPDGLTVLESKDLPYRLMGLQLRDLPGIGYNMEQRLLRAGIRSMEQLYALDAKHLRKVWGSLWGERMWYYLRGVDLPDEATHRGSVGHSHVLAPPLRPPAQARMVARRLTLKAASRLRRLGYYASVMTLSVRIENGPRLAGEVQCFRAQDSMTFLHLLDAMWAELQRETKGARLKKVSVTLLGLSSADEVEQQPELFSELPELDLRARAKAEQMSRALDAINQRFGRDTVAVGMLPEQARSFSGTKIAFTRIPDVEEFLE
jgi:DNA polymerase-4